ncbi:LytR/AlgR family response regulator transcription factor [Thomasclavelia sp.]
MIKIAICEDEEIIRKQLVNIVTSYFKKRKIDLKISVFSNGKELHKACEKDFFSCIFMDIDLGDSNGIKIIEQIRSINNYPISVIFVTGYTEYKSQALSLHTFDYIVKPFKNIQIEKVLNDLLLWIGKNYTKPIKKLTFKTMEGIVSLSIDEILYIEYVNRRIEIVTFTATYHMYGKMKAIYEYFKNDDYAIPHVSFIVNLREIKKYFKSKNLIEMTDGKQIPISQLKTKEFRNIYTKYLSKCHKDMVHT